MIGEVHSLKKKVHSTEFYGQDAVRQSSHCGLLLKLNLSLYNEITYSINELK